MSKKKNTLKTLEFEMQVKCSKFPESPLICKEFGWALFDIARFARVTIESYSAESKRFGANITRKNRRLRETGSTLTFYSQKSDDMAAIVIPNFYYLCHVSIWGILEEFLRDAFFITVTENIDNAKTRGNGVKSVNIPKEDLVNLAMERSRNVDDLNTLYKKILNIDLKKNEKFSDLFDMRRKRNVTAHSGFLFGYDSLTKKKDKTKSFEEEVQDLSDHAGMEFINAETILNKGEEVLPDSWYSYDPTGTETSRKLEHDFCSMVRSVWEVGYFVSKKLFEKRKTR